ncbi:MAG: hypothetical protein KF718_09600 [Polyangiaceae bacterium]|nr:hypothetical protein [Polyangiaceae bacterium]
MSFGSAVCRVTLGAALLVACRSQRAEPPAEVAPADSVASSLPAAPRCRAVTPGVRFTMGQPSLRPADAGEEEDEPAAPLPFAVELGGAVAHDGGFAVSALSAKGGGTTALVALVDGAGKGGRLVQLGATHGDVEPPRLAARGAAVVAVVPDSDAGGGRLRLARIDVGAASVTWGGELPEARDESHALDVELGPKRAVVVWDEVTKGERRGVIRVASFAADDPSNVTAARTLSSGDEDAEAPQLAPRPGGFWAAWLVRAAPPAVVRAPAGKRAPSPATAASDQPDPPVVELGRRRLRLVPLDENGARLGEPLDVTAPLSQVLVFDLASSAQGDALLAYRDEPTSPGVEAEVVRFARVLPGGSVEHHDLADAAVGAGVPSLLVDLAAPAAGQRLWLSLGSVTDVTRLGALDAAAKLLDRLDTEPALGAGEPIAARAGRLLVAEPKGLAMDLFVLGCERGAPPRPERDE